MTLNFVLSQILTVLAYAFYGLSFLKSERKKIVVVNLIGVIVNAIAFVFLGAWTGLAMSFVSTMRAIYSLLTEKDGVKPNPKRDLAVLIITCATSIAISIPTYNGAICIMPVIGSLLYNYSIWQKDPLVFKLLGIPVAITWAFYNAYIGSVFGVILEGVLSLFSIYGYVTATKAAKKVKDGSAKSSKRYAESY